jgi:hypothetical protein
MLGYSMAEKLTLGVAADTLTPPNTLLTAIIIDSNPIVLLFL